MSDGHEIVVSAQEKTTKFSSLWTGFMHNSCVAWAQIQYIWKQKAALGTPWCCCKDLNNLLWWQQQTKPSLVLPFCRLFWSWLLSDSAINMTSKSRKAQMPSTKDLWWQRYQRWSNLSFIMLPSSPGMTHVLTLFHSGFSLATSTSLR